MLFGNLFVFTFGAMFQKVNIERSVTSNITLSDRRYSEYFYGVMVFFLWGML